MNWKLIKDVILASLATIGSAIINFYGGWSDAMLTLIIFMTVDYITGLVLAFVFKKSPKTPSGGASSKVCLYGLLRKGAILLVVLVAAQLDFALHTHFVRDVVILYFVANEGISILENVGNMGVPYPPFLKKALDELKKKSDEGEKPDTLPSKDDEGNNPL